MRGPRGGTVPRLAVLAGLAVGATACKDILFTEPAAAPASLAIVPARDTRGAGVSADILAKADQIHVRVESSTGRELIDRVLDFTFDGSEARVRVSVPVEGDRESVRVTYRLLVDGSVIFTGEDLVELTPGETAQVRGELVPQIVEITLPSPPTFQSLGDTVTVAAQAMVATGDVVEADLAWSSSNPSVLESLGGGSFLVRGEGTTTVSASMGEVRSTRTVEIRVPVASITIQPSPITVMDGDTVTVRAWAQDARGNRLVRTLSWQTDGPNTDPVSYFATLPDSAGRIVGNRPGMENLTVSADGVSETTQITVTETDDGPTLGTGDVQVTLTWDNSADLDLWVTDPAGERIYFNNRTSATGGQLDVDDTDGFGPENIFWPVGGAPAGEYIVEVDHFSGPAPSGYTVVVKTSSGTSNYTGSLSSGQTVEVTRFTVTGSGSASVASPGAAARAIQGNRPRPPKS